MLVAPSCTNMPFCVHVGTPLGGGGGGIQGLFCEASLGVLGIQDICFQVYRILNHSIPYPWKLLSLLPLGIWELLCSIFWLLSRILNI